jgi:hypothetical protein
VTIHVVAIHHTTHTCPADPDPHAVDTRRTVLAVIDGGPCRAPVTIRCGDTIVEIPCGRHEPRERQCGACRIIVTEHTVTSTHLHGEVAA